MLQLPSWFIFELLKIHGVSGKQTFILPLNSFLVYTLLHSFFPLTDPIPPNNIRLQALQAPNADSVEIRWDNMNQVINVTAIEMCSYLQCLTTVSI